MDGGSNTIKDNNVCINVANPQMSNNSNVNFTQNVSGGNIVVINNYYKKEQSKSKVNDPQHQQQQSQSKLNNNPITNKNKEPSIRYDKLGNVIARDGKHKVTFIDKVSKKRLAEVFEIESFKKENFFELKPSINPNMSCCITY